MESAYIIDGIRTPIGSFAGALSSVRTDDLAALVIKALIARNENIPTAVIDDVIMGCANQAGEDNRNVARMSLLLAGLPHTVPGETVNRLCASGMSAVVHANRAVKSGDGAVFIAGGVENMSRGPWVISKTSKPFGNDAEMYDSSFGWRFINPLMKAMYGVDTMGATAENLASQYKITRHDQDQFAYWSQQKASIAQQQKRWETELLPVSVVQAKGQAGNFAQDEFMKPFTTQEGLAKLKPAFQKDNGTVTAGNSSGLNDGAAAMFIAADSAIKKYNLVPKARVVSSAVVGVEPRTMGIGPVGATQQALAKAGISLHNIGVIELNEAFAAQCLACIRLLGLQDNDPRININGGAIALGHPLGMSGARIVYHAAMELNRQRARYALATMCVGVGQGYAVVLERV
ncbi:MAG: acetyl-CoA C-acyltransferase [Chitinophagales bacterium]|nr:acetyl-CoA C-acyltransferase [Chitinophagales bacterium]